MKKIIESIFIDTIYLSKKKQYDANDTVQTIQTRRHQQKETQ